MQIKIMAAIFISVFLAELGDKTQLATMCFSAEGQCKPWEVFVAASLALVLSTLLAVIVGAQLERFISPRNLKMLAGAVFIIIGVWTVYSGMKA